MFLKRLEFQGFKTFANRTEFEFGGGVTAIIGPNGSGKSNIADAIRWVLGEQSGRLLRTKKLEDVVFAGSSLRSPAGVADIALTFDNSSGWLPLEFAEVTIGRRAYRSGESEYYINRSRVRLRDVVELLSKGNVGQNGYTVIGQGMVDSALSLRPEDRRGLIEEAADTRRFYAKIAEAQAKLEDTLQNLDRARDIVAEIGPRLGRLQKQASQAAEHERLTVELSTLLTTWYYQSWQKAVDSLLVARESAAGLEFDLRRKQNEFAALTNRVEETREIRTALRMELDSWQKEQSVLAADLDKVCRQLAVDNERLTYLAAQKRDLSDEIAGLSANISSEMDAFAQANERLAALRSGSELDRVQLTLVQSELDELSSRHAQLQSRLAKVQERSVASASVSSDIQHRLAQLDERETRLANDEQELKTDDERLEAAAASQGRVVQQVRGQLEDCEKDRSNLEAAQEKLNAAQREVRQRIRDLEAALGETQKERAHLQSQFDTLKRFQDSYAGLYTGVRAVLQASKGGQPVAEGKGDRRQTTSQVLPRDMQGRELQVSGVIGIVASLVGVPKDLEVAVEVALGAHLQDVVVEKWADAEQAIDFLKSTKGGRATFLPLDSVRSGRIASAPDVPGVIGIASELVSYDERLHNVVRQLLGRTVIVKDLAVARGLVGSGNAHADLSLGTQIVTLAGEVARPGGSLTGGATQGRAEGAMLSRERELRELPREIQGVISRQNQIEGKLEQERSDEKRIGAEIADLSRKERQLGSSYRELEVELSKAQRKLDLLRQESEWQKGLDRQIQAERKEIDAKREELRRMLAEAAEDNARSRVALADLQRAAEEMVEARAAAQERFNELRTQLAVVGRALESEKALVANYESMLRRLGTQRDGKLERIETLAVHGSQVESEVEFLYGEKRDLEAQVEALEACIAPAIGRLSELDAEEAILLSEESELRLRVLDAERRLVQSNHALERCNEELADLRERMESEGIELPAEAIAIEGDPDLAGRPWQLSMAMRRETLVSASSHGSGSLQVLVRESEGAGGTPGDDGRSGGITGQIAADPVVLKRRIDRLRSYLRGLGLINPTAVDEYEEAKNRHDFLRAQIQDLAESEKSLREGIRLLEVQARKQFDTAFESIGREFKQFFTQLFGGGTARLVRSDEEDGRVEGLDIIAQPPGKRVQNISSLSGGERALTAIALLFAILKVNPTPFCILDEVDAALDEANVGRFVTALRNLAERTQFIVITHNRGTVELADTLYGISLGPDSVSKVVSLRLP